MKNLSHTYVCNFFFSIPYTARVSIFPFLYHVTKSVIEESDFDDLAAPQGGGYAWGVMKKNATIGATIWARCQRGFQRVVGILGH